MGAGQSCSDRCGQNCLCRCCPGDVPHGYNTALETIEDMDCNGKTVMITGANTGIGYQQAKALLLRGATVIITTRSEEKDRKTRKSLSVDTGVTEDKIKGLIIELGSFESIEKGAKAFDSLGIEKLDALCLNAGIMRLPTYQETTNGIEKTWGVNHVGHFLLTMEMMPVLKRSAPCRVISVASVAHNWSPLPFIPEKHTPPKAEDYSPSPNYGISKMSNILFALEFNKRYSKDGIVAYACHPGWINGSDLTRQENNCCRCTLNCCTFCCTVLCCWKLWHQNWKTLQQGAATQTMLSVYAADGLVPGGYYSDCRHMKKATGGKTMCHPDTIDEAKAKKLWEITEQVIAEKRGAAKATEETDLALEVETKAADEAGK